MLTIKVKWKGKCPRHPKFDPSKDPNGIKGGCLACWALSDCYLVSIKFLETLADAARRIGGDTPA